MNNFMKLVRHYSVKKNSCGLILYHDLILSEVCNGVQEMSTNSMVEILKKYNVDDNKYTIKKNIIIHENITFKSIECYCKIKKDSKIDNNID